MVKFPGHSLDWVYSPLKGKPMNKGCCKCKTNHGVSSFPAQFTQASVVCFDCLACLASPDNKMDLLDYVQPSSICLCVSRFMTVGLQQHTKRQFYLFYCFAHGVGQETPVVQHL